MWNKNNIKRKRGDGIVSISGLLKKYKESLKAPQATVINGFVEVVYDVVGVEIYAHQCSYTPQTQTLAITTPGTIKSEILFKKDEIFKKLTEKLGVKNTPKQLI